jgi:hypothetical protein
MADRWYPKDLGSSRYVWLPVTVDGRFATIAWRDEWRLDAMAATGSKTQPHHTA